MLFKFFLDAIYFLIVFFFALAMAYHVLTSAQILSDCNHVSIAVKPT